MADDYPLGEYPPVTWWQVQNIPYVVFAEVIAPIAISVIEATLDAISIALLGKTWTELVLQLPPNGEHNPARPSDCSRLCGAPGCASWGCLS
ncbi:Uncharacterised protein [Mycobacteroides abscessus subsp. bolletii]|uniref:Uncharacterized protein n=1 Tax=Mycobacteroides abscessus subsp. bolletii TaxID=319705 RepID=A0A9Q7SE58_9MYCO|nr:Uncharacterised protein [Mycobacteroides abscessus subsp. bolletii]SHU02562.1 Uncharacterised protein [Mycobacteroides abscessus subsp. bolletii]SHX42766.1 Uncharacterised protein [Mycobacteroides abscessus subsp. bolletii]SKM65071.1 Uncharacterised protein [Mycobacteroides abscessus subsp. bolletii]SKN39117.1 Uncharacterised protein [Mycobacteroides abscessus subsp. bolletii]